MKTNIRRGLSVLAAILIVTMLTTLLSGCVQQQNEITSTSTQNPSTSNAVPVPKEPIKIPLVAPMTGDNMQYGASLQLGVSLRIEEFNGAGGLDGRMIELSVHDDKNDAKETVNVVNGLIDDPDLFLVLGPFSSTCSMAVSPLLQKAEILQYALNASHPDATQAGDWIFRGPVTQAEVQRQYAAFVYNTMGHRSIAVMYLNNDWGKSTNDVFSEEFIRLGGTITNNESFMEGQTKDFTPMLTKMKNNNPDGMFVIAQYNDTATALNQMTTLDIQCTRYITDSSARPELIDLAGDNAENTYWLAPFYLENPNAQFQELRQKVLERSGQEVESFTAGAYENMGVVCAAILATGGTDKFALKEYMTNLKDFEGLAGKWGFDETRSPTKPLFVLTIKDGVIVLFEK